MTRREAPSGGRHLAKRDAKGPAEPGWGPDGSAGGAGRHAPCDDEPGGYAVALARQDE
jgi:hypothetical protein